MLAINKFFNLLWEHRLFVLIGQIINLIIGLVCLWQGQLLLTLILFLSSVYVIINSYRELVGYDLLVYENQVLTDSFENLPFACLVFNENLQILFINRYLQKITKRTVLFNIYEFLERFEDTSDTLHILKKFKNNPQDLQSSEIVIDRDKLFMLHNIPLSNNLFIWVFLEIKSGNNLLFNDYLLPVINIYNKRVTPLNKLAIVLSDKINTFVEQNEILLQNYLIIEDMLLINFNNRDNQNLYLIFYYQNFALNLQPPKTIEVIKEVEVRVPVEVLKEVEVRVEVPMDSKTFAHSILEFCPFAAILIDENYEILHLNGLFEKIKQNLMHGLNNCQVMVNINMLQTQEMGNYHQSLLNNICFYIAEEHLEKFKNNLQKINGPSPIKISFTTNADLPFLVFTKYIASLNNYLIIFIDNADQQKLELQMAQSQKMQAIGQLAGGIAHDFNNLLTAIIGFSDIMLMRRSPTDYEFNDMMQIKQNANRAANLVRQLLAFSRKQNLQTKIINIKDNLSELGELLRRLLGATVELKVNYGENLYKMRVDPNQLEQVIINLVVNARDAMVNGGVVLINVKNFINLEDMHFAEESMSPGKYLLIEIEDNGSGIDPSIIPRIFEPFFSTKPVGSGTGLGLSTVYGIVRQTGGFIRVNSVLNKGTTFSLFFPACEEEPMENTESSTQDMSALLDSNLVGEENILLVEDEDAVRIFINKVLTAKGYMVTEVSNPEMALEYLYDTNFKLDLLISDVVMPKMDGVDLLTKALERRSNFKVLFISGYTQEQLSESLNKLSGINIWFLSKPFTAQELCTKIKSIL